MNFSNYPILKLLLPYIIGVFFAYFVDISSLSIHFFILIFLCLLLLSIIFCRNLKEKWRRLGAIFLFFSSLFLGLTTTFFHYSNFPTEKERELIENEFLWSVCIVEKPVEKAKSVKFVVKVERSLKGENLERKAVIYIAKDSVSKLLSYGDRLFITAFFSPIEPARNPESFDFQNYLRRRSIYLTAYVPAYSWKKIGTTSQNVIKKKAISLQSTFTQCFANSGLIGKEYDIITAILLGADETMDPELKAQYASAGVSHILCVSGMHVGIIFMIISFLLKPLDSNRKSKLIKTFIILLFIWFYAAITGFSPSVQRASVMFSFASVGGVLRRNTNIFHSLFASLFLLLLINPLLIFEIGFQLSYLAVFGIVLFQKKIFNLLTIKIRILNYFWELASVSIAAQLATFPIAIFYFGQFPNYFLISNLSVIFLSFIIMITGITTLFSSLIPILSQFIGTILTYEIKIMNGIIKWVDNLPGAVTNHLYFSIFQVIAIYCSILLIYFFIQTKSKKAFIVATFAFSLFCTTFAVRKSINLKKNIITVFAIPKESALHFQNGKNSYLLSDSIYHQEQKQYQQYIKNYERKHNIRCSLFSNDSSSILTTSIYKNGNFIYFMNKKIYLLSGLQKLYPSGDKTEVDYIIVQSNSKTSPEVLESLFDFKLLIIDGNNSFYQEKKWREWCLSRQIKYHSVLKDGSLTIKL